MQANEPSTINEALSSSEADKWKEAMEREMESLKANDVYDLVELPKNKEVIGSKWIFRRKINADGSVERYKARLVAQRFSQTHGLDYDETFCRVVCFESIRSVIAVAVQNDLILHQMHVTSAFLTGTLEEEVFMQQPEGCYKSEGDTQLVCRLKQRLYGLKQVPMCWNTALDTHQSII
uniref:Reverse transcriptase Ty1/copia-type domain-containing protein n=1 Tax=Amphimedon queenslandica TaxID=400682 RepID=A0A1X7VXK3_AMPQE